MDRRIALEGVDNFRDFGGYATAGGGRLKRGRLYRSASHGRASDADLEVIASLGIATVVDLRRKTERLRDPSRRPNEFAGAVIENDLGDDVEDEWLAHLRQSDLTEASFHAYLLGYYEKAPADPRHIDLFARFFRALTESDRPVLIHCAAGKDRTGILTALTHRLAGVHHDDIVEDYLLTNDEARFALRGPQIVEYIQGIAGRAPTIAAVRVAMGVEAAFLDRAFSAIDREFGGLHAYFEKRLGIDPDRRRVLRDRLVE